MAEEQASNGVAAVCPTTGIIFSVADATRHGSAATPQPPSGNTIAHSSEPAASRTLRTTLRRKIDLVTGAPRYAVVST